jgi:hypothetical protein
MYAYNFYMQAKNFFSIPLICGVFIELCLNILNSDFINLKSEKQKSPKPGLFYLKFNLFLQFFHIGFELFVGFNKVIHCTAGMQYCGMIFIAAMQTNGSQR